MLQHIIILLDLILNLFTLNQSSIFWANSMNTVERVINHAEQQCKQRGTRLTPKRKQVLAGLVQSGRALSAYELIDVYKEMFGEALPATSMYRILEFLQEEHLVHRLNLANKYVACSHITCNHDHTVPQFLICDKCQTVKEIGIDKKLLTELQSNVKQAGFHLTSTQLEMSCICKSCLKEAA